MKHFDFVHANIFFPKFIPEYLQVLRGKNSNCIFYNSLSNVS